MRGITFRGIQDLAFEEVPDPSIEAATDVVLRVSVAGICGSDLHPYFGREVGIDPGTVMGHEMVGEVVDVGPDVRRFRTGDRVVAPFTTSCGDCHYCRLSLTARCVRGQFFGWVQGGVGLQGAQAELVRVPLADSSLIPVPEGLDDAVAMLAGDILSTAAFGADLAGVRAGDLVVVVGCGPVGVLAVRASLERGAREVIAVDRVPGRLALAERFGATPADFERGDPLAVVRERSEGHGADAAIEAVGTPEATRLAADMLRSGGSLAAVGFHVEPHLAISPGEIYDRNLRYSGGRCPARHYMPDSLRLAQRDAELISTLVSHRIPLSRGVEAYDNFAERKEGWTKVVLLPGAV